MDIPDANIPRPKIPVISDMQLRKRKLNDKAVVKNVVVENQTIDEIQATSPRKLPLKLPDSEKFENITRPLIALNCDTLAKKRKLNKGSQTKPKDKDIVNNQVSKNIFSV